MKFSESIFMALVPEVEKFSSIQSIMGTIKKFDCIQIWYLINSVLNKLLETSLRWKLKRSKREILLELMCDRISMKWGFRSSRKESLLKIQKLEPDTPRQLAEKEPADQNDSNWISINWVHIISPTHPTVSNVIRTTLSNFPDTLQ